MLKTDRLTDSIIMINLVTCRTRYPEARRWAAPIRHVTRMTRVVGESIGAD
jgi:hypothetical protein